MQKNKKILWGTILLGIVIGWFTLGGTTLLMKATSSTEFCISCHTMTSAYEEYQGSKHFLNAKGIKAECSDCHIPSSPVDYLITKIRASKDIYHEFVTGKIDTPEKYEENRLAMAETVWEHMRSNDSATCRSCHELGDMDLYEQSESAMKMHAYAKENNQTCIECHKGVAHFPPTLELDNSAFDHLFELAKNTATDAKYVYPIEPVNIDTLGSINPTVKLEVLKVNETERTLKVAGSQMKGAESVLYVAEGKRSIIAKLTEQAQSMLEVGQYTTDEYGNQWRPASLTFNTDTEMLDSVEPLWEYAKQLDTVYCSTCHAKIAGHHFTVNAWGPVAKGMGDRTDISESNLEILTKFFQSHAKDAVEH